jgi:hypothetical protein
VLTVEAAQAEEDSGELPSGAARTSISIRVNEEFATRPGSGCRFGVDALREPGACERAGFLVQCRRRDPALQVAGLLRAAKVRGRLGGLGVSTDETP